MSPKILTGDVQEPARRVRISKLCFPRGGRACSMLATTTASKSSSSESSTSGTAMAWCAVASSWIDGRRSSTSSETAGTPSGAPTKHRLPPGTTEATKTSTSAGASDNNAPNLAWSCARAFSENASPAMKSDTVRPTDEMTPSTQSARNDMPSGRGNPSATASCDPPTNPTVLPTSNERKTTSEYPPTPLRSTPAFTVPKRNRTPKSTKPLHACSKSCKGDLAWRARCAEMVDASSSDASSKSSSSSFFGSSRLSGRNGTTKHSARDGCTAA
mmetsp:Transcript_9407/g.28466  ORF Transcript_9407/g.28466 Transcript_9407/m.28466 type:complete len:272 (-) Transcript_9407:1578-2393(-)